MESSIYTNMYDMHDGILFRLSSETMKFGEIAHEN